MLQLPELKQVHERRRSRDQPPRVADEARRDVEEQPAPPKGQLRAHRLDTDDQRHGKEKRRRRRQDQPHGPDPREEHQAGQRQTHQQGQAGQRRTKAHQRRLPESAPVQDDADDVRSHPGIHDTRHPARGPVPAPGEPHAESD